MLVINQLTLPVILQLSEVGFLANEMGLTDDAIAIFSGLVKARPDLPYLTINLALTHAHAGGYGVAIDLLEPLIEKFPDIQMIKAVLGLCFTHEGRSGAFTLLNEILTLGTDAEAMSVAQSYYDLAKQQEEARQFKSATQGLQYVRHYNISSVV